MPLALALGLASALAFGPVPSGSPARAPAILTLQAGGQGSAGAPRPVASAAMPRLPGAAAPICIGDVCQPVVAVPGFDPQFSSVRRNELFAMFLNRAGIEPFASIANALLATGVRVEYDPGVFNGHNGWGSLTLGLRWRLDAWNEPVFSGSAGRRR